MSVDFSGSHKAMDPREHERTYSAFVRWTTIFTAHIVVILVVMALILV